jgi:recombinational DNA repair protein RecT
LLELNLALDEVAVKITRAKSATFTLAAFVVAALGLEVTPDQGPAHVANWADAKKFIIKKAQANAIAFVKLK